MEEFVGLIFYFGVNIIEFRSHHAFYNFTIVLRHVSGSLENSKKFKEYVNLHP